MSCNNPFLACKNKLDEVASCLINGVASAFFSSLDWLSCMYVDTRDDPEDDFNYLPLVSKPEMEESPSSKS
ncbi:hypothetical protein K1719_043409 [Acacia pycnantha]|nr:hypothetical protein K1719_043409 [Acacia pycnantha]